jgi:tRNA nucleotidyltransferase (CCA-adding enzyme)
VAKADLEGRPPRQDDFPEGPWLLERAEDLMVKDSEPKPIVLGRHLVDRGLEPGPSFGPVLEKCFEAQLDGEFSDETSGLFYLDGLLEQNN